MGKAGKISIDYRVILRIFFQQLYNNGVCNSAI